MGARRMALLIGVIALLCSFAFGQGGTGTLTGTVLDPGGAAVPNAKVQIKNLSTGASRETVSGPEGIFVFNSVIPARYDLTITATAGFKSYSSKDIAVSATETRDLGKISLILGSVTEEISVTAAATPVQTASSESSKLVESSQISTITMKGRDLFGILQTIPGVSFGNNMLSGTNADATSNGSGSFGAMQINGGGTARTNFTVDGVIDLDNGNNAQLNFEPTMDSIAEIRVLTSNYQAEYGHSSSGQINVITKGGSQEFHGTAFVNKRHEMFNAHTWDQGYKKTTDKNKYRYFVWGYTIGGPLYIPRLFNTQKKKLFFFWSQEYTKQKPNSSSTMTAMVPTADQLAGNFFDRCITTGQTLVNGIPQNCVRGYADNSGNRKDQTTGGYLVDPTVATRPFLSSGNLNDLVGKQVNGVDIVDPTSSAIGRAMLKYMPSPNMCTPAAGVYNGQAISPTNCPAGYRTDLPYAQNPGWAYGANYIWGYTEDHPRRNDTARVDWNITSRLNSYVRWSRDYDTANQGYQLPIRNAANQFNPFSVDFNKPGHGVAVGLTATISPTTVNEFTFGKIWNGIGWYNHDDTQALRSNIMSQTDLPSSIAFPAFQNLSNSPLVTGDVGTRWLMSSKGQMNFADYVPNFSYGAGSGRSEAAPNTAQCWGQCPYTNWAESWTFSDSISKVWGKHNLKAGIYVEKTAKDQAGNNGNYLGQWSFGPNGSNPLDVNDGYANAWLGNFNQYAEGQRNFSEWWFWQTEFFVQDSWRVTRRLTLDLGARFYAMPPITNTSTGRNASSVFVPEAYNSGAQMRIYEQACMWLSGANAGTRYSTANGPCPNNATAGQRAWDRATNTFAGNWLVGTFVPASAGGYTGTPTPTSGLLAGGSSPLVPKGLYTAPTISPAFRFGFAWDVFGNGKTAIRGGIGQFLNRLSYNQIAAANGYTLPPAQTLYFGHIMDVADPAKQAAGSMSPMSLNVGFIGKQQNESTYNGSFGIQQNVGFSTVVEANYVFNLRRHIPYTQNRNYYPVFSQYDNAAAWVNPMNEYQQNPAVTGWNLANYGLARNGDNYVYQMGGVCPTCVAGYGQIARMGFEESANYHSLQVNVRRNMTQHLSFGWSFTWNKYMSLGSAALNNNDPGVGRSVSFPDKYRNWGPSYSPTPQYFTVNFVYEAPNLGQKLNFKPLGWVTDHWTVSGLGQWRSNAMAGIPGFSFSNTQGNCTSPANPPAGTWSQCYPQWNWTGSSEGARANVVGDYHLSSVGKTWSYNPAVATNATTTIPAPAGANPGVPSIYDSFSTGDNWIINPAAFAAPMPCSKTPGVSPFTGLADPRYGIGEDMSCFGNAGAGSLLNIPGTRVNNWDLTLSKQFPLKSERRNLTFRMEMYNVMNHPNFTLPGFGGIGVDTWDWRNWLQGRLVNTNAGMNRLGGTLNPRQMSMSLRLVF